MKKKLLLIILLLVPFLVKAQEKYTYEWDKYNENNILFIGEKDDKYETYTYNTNNERILTYYQPDGKKISSRSLDLNNNEEDMEYFYSFINKFSMGDLLNEYNGKTYVLNPQLLRIYERNETNSAEPTIYDYLDLTEEQQKNYTGDFHLLFEAYYDNSDSTNLLLVKDNGYILYRVVPINNAEPRFYMDVYDKSEELILTKRFNPLDKFYSADIKENGIYVTEALYDLDERSVSYSLIKYDLNGKELFTQDINEEIKKNSIIVEEKLYGSIATFTDKVNDGLVLSISENTFIGGYESCISSVSNGTTVTDNPKEYCRALVLGVRQPSQIIYFNISSHWNSQALIEAIIPKMIIKLENTGYIDYQITPKVQGEGEIKVIDRSAAGGEVTFEVTPKEGYVLSVVKVTDAAGNVITFTDYTFTMPSSDVTIEAVFVPGNPNTTDIAIMGIIIVGILFGAIAVINYKKLVK